MRCLDKTAASHIRASEFDSWLWLLVLASCQGRRCGALGDSLSGWVPTTHWKTWIEFQLLTPTSASSTCCRPLGSEPVDGSTLLLALSLSFSHGKKKKKIDCGVNSIYIYYIYMKPMHSFFHNTRFPWTSLKTPSCIPSSRFLHFFGPFTWKLISFFLFSWCWFHKCCSLRQDRSRFSLLRKTNSLSFSFLLFKHLIVSRPSSFLVRALARPRVCCLPSCE